LLLVAALHAALLFMASQWQMQVALRREESLVFLTLPSRVQSAAETEPPAQPSPQKKPAPSHDTQLVIVPTPAQPPPVEQSAAPIDWTAEAARAAKQQAELASAPGPRALDQHGAGAGVDFDGGLGPDPDYRPEFGWDHAHTHRIEALEGGGSILWINDRCFIVMAGVIPFPMCGIGKIPPRGDLFDHMRDGPPAQSRPNIAP
jgi:hypothetical protein